MQRQSLELEIAPQLCESKHIEVQILSNHLRTYETRVIYYRLGGCKRWKYFGGVHFISTLTQTIN